MQLLVLGGTGFLSRHVVDAALQAGHQVTLFHRGRTNPELFPEIEHVLGDREHDLGLLKGRHWDAVVDVCGYYPRIVGANAAELAPLVGNYVFISSLNAYAEENAEVLDEDSPLAVLPEGAQEEFTPETYGAFKVLCEQAVERAFPGRTLIIRPGLLVGPADSSGRFTYWPRRLARGGEVLAPDHKDQLIGFIDVRDTAAWIIALLERGQTGIYNADGPAEHLTLEYFLQAAASIIGSDTHYTWVSEEFLTEKGIQPWTELPLWTLREWGNSLNAASSQKAIAAGLTFRPLAQTLLDTLAWDTANPAFPVKNKTLTPEKEAALLQEWHARSAQ
ncbi:NAD-dependent epimerase/dehydratase family protein [Dictyobacter arantiisoli]|uniref:NAD-dependent epimerase/dehydratase domain-containing protein n=1 Tax=Dictyobacter arantiisoli TaxID=2014874 RepID=A0A5A5TEI2_9CHLR|nr:NAD-dependent epimerase/dehydratase family protein [Dictyobacter arantiisoli]GCF09556.1 hypothetical protein KDI_31200 [Dictyobacter arantiisoli]